MEENIGDLYANVPLAVSEAGPVNEEPLYHGDESPEKKKDTNAPDSASNPAKTESVEETPNSDELKQIEERQIQCIIESELLKKKEAETLLTIYDEVKLVTEEYTYIGYAKKEDGSEPKERIKDFFGICNYTNGDSYIGQYSNNMKHGYGKYFFKNGNVCYGEFVNDKQEGYAEISKANTTWKAEMKESKPIKGPLIIEKDGEVCFEGILLTSDNNKAISHGKHQEKEKVFFGELEENTYRQGYCVKYRKNKNIFVGNMNKNVRDGYGEYYLQDGSRYFGFYKNNLRHGFGIEVSKDKAVLSKFEGDFKNGLTIVNQKGAIKIELWHLGFKCKVIENFEAAPTKLYLKNNYPEYSWVLGINYKKIFETVLNVNVEDLISIIEIKPEPKTKKVENEGKENETVVEIKK